MSGVFLTPGIFDGPCPCGSGLLSTACYCECYDCAGESVTTCSCNHGEFEIDENGDYTPASDIKYFQKKLFKALKVPAKHRANTSDLSVDEDFYVPVRKGKIKMENVGNDDITQSQSWVKHPSKPHVELCASENDEMGH